MDVERVFDALKNRIVWLKSKILYTKIPTITAAVKVFSILYNRLLEYDNNMIDFQFDWENIDPNAPDDDELYEQYVNSTVPVPEPTLVDDPLLPVPSQVALYFAVTTYYLPTQTIPATAPMEYGEEPQQYSNSNHVILNASLIKHFSYAKRFTNFQRKAMYILRTVLSRAKDCLRARLVIQPSNLRRKNFVSGVYDMPIGISYIPKTVCISAVYMFNILAIYDMIK